MCIRDRSYRHRHHLHPLRLSRWLVVQCSCKFIRKKINTFIRVSPPGWCHSGRPVPHPSAPSDATDSVVDHRRNTQPVFSAAGCSAVSTGVIQCDKRQHSAMLTVIHVTTTLGQSQLPVCLLLTTTLHRHIVDWYHRISPQSTVKTLSKLILLKRYTQFSLNARPEVHCEAK